MDLFYFARKQTIFSMRFKYRAFANLSIVNAKAYKLFLKNYQSLRKMKERKKSKQKSKQKPKKIDDDEELFNNSICKENA